MRAAIAGVTDVHGRDEHLPASNLLVLVLPHRPRRMILDLELKSITLRNSSSGLPAGVHRCTHTGDAGSGYRQQLQRRRLC
jgi:hypothetical protein